MLVVPAVNNGLNGRLRPGHGLPLGPEAIWKEEVVSIGPLPSHGVNKAWVVYVPQREGVVSGARSPPKKCSSRFSKGRSGVFLNVVTICPVSLRLTSPVSLMTVPDTGSSTIRY